MSYVAHVTEESLTNEHNWFKHLGLVISYPSTQPRDYVDILLTVYCVLVSSLTQHDTSSC